MTRERRRQAITTRCALLVLVGLSVHGALTWHNVFADSGVLLNAPTVKQDKPLDCESAALQVAMNVAGFNVNQDQIFNALPVDTRAAVVSNGKVQQWGDAYADFVGNVYGSESNYTGYGVYYPEVAAVAREFGATVINAGTGWTVPAIEGQLSQGFAVMVWLTTDFQPHTVSYWTAWDGRSIPYIVGDHTVTVIGYGGGNITVVDVRTGTRETFTEGQFGSALTTFSGMGLAIAPAYRVHFAKLDGNNAGASAIAVDDQNMWIEHNSGGSLAGPTQASSGAFYGSIVTTFADLDGLGRASAIAVNSNDVWVEHNNGNDTFAAPQQADSGPFYGSIATLAGDVDGLGKSSLIAINASQAYVELNRGIDTFGPAQLAANNGAFYGSVATGIADVDGSGRMSLIAINAADVWVERNLGNDTFGAPTELIGNAPFYGSIATLSGDVDGLKFDSFLALNWDNAYVEHNNGGSVGPPQQAAYNGAFYGSLLTTAVDLDGTGRASLVAVNTQAIWAERNQNGPSFGGPEQIAGSLFYGTH